MTAPRHSWLDRIPQKVWNLLLALGLAATFVMCVVVLRWQSRERDERDEAIIERNRRVVCAILSTLEDASDNGPRSEFIMLLNANLTEQGVAVDPEECAVP